MAHEYRWSLLNLRVASFDSVLMLAAHRRRHHLRIDWIGDVIVRDAQHKASGNSRYTGYGFRDHWHFHRPIAGRLVKHHELVISQHSDRTWRGTGLAERGVGLYARWLRIDLNLVRLTPSRDR